MLITKCEKCQHEQICKNWKEKFPDNDSDTTNCKDYLSKRELEINVAMNEAQQAFGELRGILDKIEELKEGKNETKD